MKMSSLVIGAMALIALALFVAGCMASLTHGSEMLGRMLLVACLIVTLAGAGIYVIRGLD